MEQPQQKKQKRSPDLCIKCGDPAQTSPGYLGKCPKCPKCREARRPRYAGFDRWANGNQYGSYNSDED